MLDTIYDALFVNYSIIQLVVAIIALIHWRKYKKIEYRLFIISLWVIVFIEVFALYYGRHISDVGYNKIVYNFKSVINFYFTFWLFYRFTSNRTFKKIIIFFCILYFLSICIEIGYQEMNYYKSSQIIPYIIGGFGILLCVFYYFSETLNSPKIIYIYNELFFWVVVSLFVYYLVFIPFKIGETYFLKFKSLFDLYYIKQGITIFSSLILITGFLCSKKKD